MLRRRPRRRGDARHRPSISNKAGKQKGGERSYDSDCKSQTGSCFAPSRRGFLQVRRSYIGPSSSDARVYQRKNTGRARPIPAVASLLIIAALPRLDANRDTAPLILHPRHLRRPPFIFIPCTTASPRGHGGADSLFFLSPSPHLEGTIPTAAALFFLFPSSARQSNSYTSRHTVHNTNTNTTTTTSKYYIAMNTTGVYIFSFSHFPPCARGREGREDVGWCCRFPVAALSEAELYPPFYLSVYSRAHRRWKELSCHVACARDGMGPARRQKRTGAHRTHYLLFLGGGEGAVTFFGTRTTKKGGWGVVDTKTI